MLHRTISLLIMKDGKLLLVKDSRERYGFKWCVPGGHVDEGESPYDAALREAREEVGKVYLDSKEVMTFVHDAPAGEKNHPRHQHECHVFTGKLSGEVKLSSEATDYGWFTLEEAGKMDLAEFTKTIIDFLVGR